jgi:hypothetical protein
MPSNSSALLDTLLTTEDREVLRGELELLKTAIFKVNKDSFAETMKVGVRAFVAEIIEKELRTNNVDPEKYLNEMLQNIDKLPTLELTIAFEPTQANLEHFATQASTVAGQNVLLQVSTKPEIIGGAVVIWNGKYVDATLQTTFDETVQKVLAKYL